ncbi:MAG: hypothetical protein ACODAJ_03530 [Planctomycetota bacterium]
MDNRVIGCLLAMASVGALAGETVRLRATADVWLSDANAQERNSSAGKHPRLKLKTIQEMASIRFDAAPARGREVLEARLFLRRASSDQLRYIRVSTVNGDWVEGGSTRAYGPPDGASFQYAEAGKQRPWAWPGSQFCDVVMGSGHSLVTWAERKELPNRWIAVPLTPALVYALVAGDTDGLAVMDGGTLDYHNNMIHSVQSSGSAPYIEAELGKPLTQAPARPDVVAEPAPARAGLDTGALKLTIAHDPRTFCWKLTLNGRPVERWRVNHPELKGPAVIFLEGLPPGRECAIEIVAVARGGAASAPTKFEVTASPALARPPSLGKLRKPAPGAAFGPRPKARMSVWVLPGLVKLSPERPEAMFGDMARQNGNAVWDGQNVELFGARAEYVSYQLCIENGEAEPLTGIKITPQPLQGSDGATIGGSEIELFRNWYARNRKDQWQPAYCAPMAHGEPFQIPDPTRKLPEQQNQTVYVDVYIPKDAKPGAYKGSVKVTADGADAVTLPVQLTVFDFVLPDRLSFWPELNAYRIPPDAHDYYRLAHQHRCVANYWRWQPRLRGSGRNIQVVWDRYDRQVGPLLTGEAFQGNRRAGVPVPVMYLPFEDSWPTPLTKQTYDYQGHWPGRGEDKKWITRHYLEAPYIGDALSQDYTDAFRAVQRQFIEHFREEGYTRTEMQCFYGGKNTHRIRYGSNMWWTTDEPYHWDDWLALQFFCRLWTANRGGADPRLWVARADISRPQWQDRVLDGIVGPVYFGAGAFTSQPMVRRCRILAQETGLERRMYGAANKDDESNTRSVVWCLNAWLNGANAVLPWQTLGRERSLDVNDRGAGGGNALIVPAKRLGHTVVGDMRLKALRDGQQLIEYLVLVARRRDLSRRQIKAMLHRAVRLEAGTRAGTGLDNADALQFGTLQAWQLAGLRRALAELIAGK